MTENQNVDHAGKSSIVLPETDGVKYVPAEMLDTFHFQNDRETAILLYQSKTILGLTLARYFLTPDQITDILLKSLQQDKDIDVSPLSCQNPDIASFLITPKDNNKDKFPTLIVAGNGDCQEISVFSENQTSPDRLIELLEYIGTHACLAEPSVQQRAVPESEENNKPEKIEAASNLMEASSNTDVISQTSSHETEAVLPAAFWPEEHSEGWYSQPAALPSVSAKPDISGSSVAKAEMSVNDAPLLWQDTESKTINIQMQITDFEADISQNHEKIDELEVRKLKISEEINHINSRLEHLTHIKEHQNAQIKIQRLEWDKSHFEAITEKKVQLKEAEMEEKGLEETIRNLSVFSFFRKKKLQARLQAAKERKSSLENELSSILSKSFNGNSCPQLLLEAEEQIADLNTQAKTCQNQLLAVEVEIGQAKDRIQELENQKSAAENELLVLENNQKTERSVPSQQEVRLDQLEETQLDHTGESDYFPVVVSENSFIQDESAPEIPISPHHMDMEYVEVNEGPNENIPDLYETMRPVQKDLLLHSFQTCKDPDAFFDDFLYYNKNHCQFPEIREFFDSFDQPKDGKNIVPDLIDTVSDTNRPYYQIRYDYFKREPDLIVQSLSWLKDNDFRFSVHGQKILYCFLNFMLRDDFQTPLPWYEKILESENLGFELYLTAAQYFMMIGRYEDAHLMLDMASAKDIKKNILFSSTERVQTKMLLDAKKNLERYEGGRPYWPLTEERRNALIPFYEQNGVPVPTKKKYRESKIKESDFKPFEVMDDPSNLTSWCAFYIDSFKAFNRIDIPYQIGAVRVENGVQVEEFEKTIRPEDGPAIKEKTADRLQMSLEALQECETVETVMPAFLKFTKGLPLLNTGILTGNGRPFLRALRYSGHDHLENSVVELLDFAADVSPDLDFENNTRAYILNSLSLSEGNNALEKARANADMFEKLKEMREHDESDT